MPKEAPGAWRPRGRRLAAALAVIGLGLAGPAHAAPAAPVGTAFTYQGQLQFLGTSVSASCSFVFGLWDAAAGGAQQGPTLTYDGQGGNPAPLQVVQGIFTTEPPLDFGSQWNGDARFLDVQVKCGADPGYTSLGRQALLGTPYSISTTSLQGHPVSQAAPASGNVLRWDGAAWAPATGDLAGDVTGPTGATQIAPSAVGSPEIADGSIQDGDVASVDAGKLTSGTLDDARLSPNVVLVAASQTLTGKTIDSTSNTVAADRLRTATGVVSVQAAAAPASGQVLTATSATSAAWQALPAGLGGSGIVNQHAKFTAATTLGPSLVQDNGVGLGFNTAPATLYLGSFYRQQQTAVGDGQHTLFGYRTRDSKNDGTAYALAAANSATAGYNFWGDVYTFGVGGWNDNDYSRTGGVLGAERDGFYWGALGYRSSALVNYGVYGSAAYASGGGLAEARDRQGVGGGFYGGLIGSWSQGEVMGQVSSGPLFASYNVGNVYTSGYTADVVAVGAESGAARVAAYAVTSPGLKVYDNGSARLEGATAFVPFGQAFAAMLGSLPDVTVSPVGAPAQLYVQSVEKDGFTVAVASGTASVKFSWIAVGNRADAARAALPAELADGGFDARIKRAMFNEGDRDGSGQEIWWDGQTVRFDPAPRPAAPAKQEAR